MAKEHKRTRPGASTPPPTTAAAPVAPFRTPGSAPAWLAQWGLIALAVALAAIPFGYGKYLEFGRKDPFDSSLNVYHAQALLDGQRHGRDMTVSARPNTLLVNVVGVAIFGYSETGPKLIQMVMQLGALALMAHAARKAFGAGPAALALVMAAFYLSLPPYAKDGNVKEQFMIACMVTTAAAWLLYELGGSRRWLLLAGGAAVNIWYFKPTGVSIIIALGVYLTATTLVHHRTWRQTAGELRLLFHGAGLGLIPLILLYGWQDMLGDLLTQFPAALVLFALGLDGAIRSIQWICQTPFLWLNRKRLVWALALPAAAFGVSSLIYAHLGQLDYFWRDIPVIAAGIKLIALGSRLTLEVKGYFNSSDGYLGGSQQVSTFATQFAEVARYSRTLLVPVGFGLAGLVIALARLIAGRKTSQTAALVTEPQFAPDRAQTVAGPIFILLAVWWLLDMAFIWISPRSYVQYYLPINGSAALLAAWVLHQTLRRPWGFVILGAAWLLLDLALAWVTALPQGGFALRGAEAVGPYWGDWTLRLIPTLALAAVVIAWRNPRQQTLRTAASIGLCLILMVAWNSQSLFGKTQPDGSKSRSAFAERAQSIGQTQYWEQIGHYIRENSQPDDGIYVWGWFPGIYLAAQRTCPAAQAAYSDMHSDSPDRVAFQANRLLSDFEKKKPRFIVDSQKAEFPFYEHPLFDLWLRWRDAKRSDIFLRLVSSQPSGGALPMTLAETGALQDQILERVAWFTKMTLTDTRRPSGPMPEAQATQRAEQERLRHAAMTPLREFVMTHYEPVRLNTDIMFVYRLKPQPVAGQ